MGGAWVAAAVVVLQLVAIGFCLGVGYAGGALGWLFGREKAKATTGAVGELADPPQRRWGGEDAREYPPRCRFESCRPPKGGE